MLGAEFVAVTGGSGVNGSIYIFIPFIVERKWNLFFSLDVRRQAVPQRRRRGMKRAGT